MRVTSGRVVSGLVVVEGEPLPEGSIVAILSREQHETFRLDEFGEHDLLQSIGEADRGEVIPAEDVLKSLRNTE